jgi:hypothetical protein
MPSLQGYLFMVGRRSVPSVSAIEPNGMRSWKKLQS